VITSALTPGPNILNDRNVDIYTPGPGGGALFAPGDTFSTVLLFDNITNSVFNQEDLEDATGVSPYQLAGVATLTIVPGGVIPTLTGAPGNVDLALSGTVDIYELPPGALNFTTEPSFASAFSTASGGTHILTLTTDFYQQLDAPPSALGLPTDLGDALEADSGFTVTFNPMAIPIIPDATPISYTPFGSVVPTMTSHDVTAIVQLIANSTATAAKYPLLTNTSIEFRVRAIPEMSAFAAFGMFATAGALGLVVAKKRRGAKAAA
jgi:hypothetical protein